MKATITAYCDMCGVMNKVKVDFPYDNQGFTNRVFTCKHCHTKNEVSDPHIYSPGGQIIGVKGVDYAMCAACDADLSECDTITAAQGTLYCSDECAEHDFKVVYGDRALDMLTEFKEYVTPADIGLVRNYEVAMDEN